jgi:hypothetical protein
LPVEIILFTYFVQTNKPEEDQLQQHLKAYDLLVKTSWTTFKKSPKSEQHQKYGRK